MSTRNTGKIRSVYYDETSPGPVKEKPRRKSDNVKGNLKRPAQSTAKRKAVSISSSTIHDSKRSAVAGKGDLAPYSLHKRNIDQDDSIEIDTDTTDEDNCHSDYDEDLPVQHKGKVKGSDVTVAKETENVVIQVPNSGHDTSGTHSSTQITADLINDSKETTGIDKTLKSSDVGQKGMSASNTDVNSISSITRHNVVKDLHEIENDIRGDTLHITIDEHINDDVFTDSTNVMSSNVGAVPGRELLTCNLSNPRGNDAGSQRDSAAYCPIVTSTTVGNHSSTQISDDTNPHLEHMKDTEAEILFISPTEVAYKTKYPSVNDNELLHCDRSDEGKSLTDIPNKHDYDYLENSIELENSLHVSNNSRSTDENRLSTSVTNENSKPNKTREYSEKAEHILSDDAEDDVFYHSIATIIDTCTDKTLHSRKRHITQTKDSGQDACQRYLTRWSSSHVTNTEILDTRNSVDPQPKGLGTNYAIEVHPLEQDHNTATSQPELNNTVTTAANSPMKLTTECTVVTDTESTMPKTTYTGIGRSRGVEAISNMITNLSAIPVEQQDVNGSKASIKTIVSRKSKEGISPQNNILVDSINEYVITQESKTSVIICMKPDVYSLLRTTINIFYRNSSKNTAKAIAIVNHVCKDTKDTTKSAITVKEADPKSSTKSITYTVTLMNDDCKMQIKCNDSFGRMIQDTNEIYELLTHMYLTNNTNTVRILLNLFKDLNQKLKVHTHTRPQTANQLSSALALHGQTIGTSAGNPGTSNMNDSSNSVCMRTQLEDIAQTRKNLEEWEKSIKAKERNLISLEKSLSKAEKDIEIKDHKLSMAQTQILVLETKLKQANEKSDILKTKGDVLEIKLSHMMEKDDRIKQLENELKAEKKKNDQMSENSNGCENSTHKSKPTHQNHHHEDNQNMTNGNPNMMSIWEKMIEQQTAVTNNAIQQMSIVSVKALEMMKDITHKPVIVHDSHSRINDDTTNHNSDPQTLIKDDKISHSKHNQDRCMIIHTSVNDTEESISEHEPQSSPTYATTSLFEHNQDACKMGHTTDCVMGEDASIHVNDKLRQGEGKGDSIIIDEFCIFDLHQNVQENHNRESAKQYVKEMSMINDAECVVHDNVGPNPPSKKESSTIIVELYDDGNKETYEETEVVQHHIDVDPNLEGLVVGDKDTWVEKEGAQHHTEDESSCQIILYEKAPISLSEKKTRDENIPIDCATQSNTTPHPANKNKPVTPNVELYDDGDNETYAEKEGAQHTIEDESSFQIILEEKPPESFSEKNTREDNALLDCDTQANTTPHPPSQNKPSTPNVELYDDCDNKTYVENEGVQHQVEMDPNLEEHDGGDKGTRVEKEGAQHHIEDESSCQITLYEKAPESFSEKKTKDDNILPDCATQSTEQQYVNEMTVRNCTESTVHVNSGPHPLSKNKQYKPADEMQYVDEYTEYCVEGSKDIQCKSYLSQDNAAPIPQQKRNAPRTLIYVNSAHKNKRHNKGRSESC